MSIIKLIAAKRLPDGTWVEQQEVEMHPLEEAEHLAHQALCEHHSRKPQMPVADDMLKAILKNGNEHAAKMVSDAEGALLTWTQEHEPLIAVHNAAKAAWDAYLSKQGEGDAINKI